MLNKCLIFLTPGDKKAKIGELIIQCDYLIIAPHGSKWDNAQYLYITYENVIIASTDLKLNLPLPSPQFIERYIEKFNEGKQITQIMVLFEENLLKVNPKDNTITIKKLKDYFDREEVTKHCRNAMLEYAFCSISNQPYNQEEFEQAFAEWIDNNL